MKEMKILRSINHVWYMAQQYLMCCCCLHHQHHHHHHRNLNEWNGQQRLYKQYVYVCARAQATLFYVLNFFFFVNITIDILFRFESFSICYKKKMANEDEKKGKRRKEKKIVLHPKIRYVFFFISFFYIFTPLLQMQFFHCVCERENEKKKYNILYYIFFMKITHKNKLDYYYRFPVYSFQLLPNTLTNTIRRKR